MHITCIWGCSIEVSGHQPLRHVIVFYCLTTQMPRKYLSWVMNQFIRLPTVHCYMVSILKISLNNHPDHNNYHYVVFSIGAREIISWCKWSHDLENYYFLMPFIVINTIQFMPHCFFISMSAAFLS
jgi:hypothetical protein